MERILITGSSGFIGMHISLNLLNSGYEVCGVDDMNDYYDPYLKEARLKILLDYKNFTFYNADISELKPIKKIFKDFKPQKVVNLAAQAGVRYSLKNPYAYIQSNIIGFTNIIESCRDFNVKGLIYASSSSVYGLNNNIPFSVTDRVDKPISMYAVSKKTNELIAHEYSHLYNLNSTGLRFFTVYGPWGRPDMAMYKFVDKIIKNQKIKIYNHGEMFRDFTYIEDIIDGLRASIESNYKFEIFNLGNSRCEKLMDMVKHIEQELNKSALIEFVDMQPGDVFKTFANISSAKEKLNFNPQTSIRDGIPKFINWYKDYHGLN